MSIPLAIGLANWFGNSVEVPDSLIKPYFPATLLMA